MSTQSTHRSQPPLRWWQRWRKPVYRTFADPAETARQLKARIAHREDAETTQELKPVGAEPAAHGVPSLALERGHMQQRPGSYFHDTLLAPCNPHPLLADFKEGDEVMLNELAEGDVFGLYGRVSRRVPWRAVRPIGVRIHGDGWARLLWCEPHELVILRRAGAATVTMPQVGSYL